MKIEEAKKTVDKLSVDSDEFWKIPMIPAHKVKAFDQPKPVVPQFVAEWIEYCKKRALTLKGLFSNSDMPAKIFDWIFGSDENCRLMAEAWINGYTVEKEPLYTVEIPNPNGCNLYLIKTDKEVVITSDVMADVFPDKLKLTESEIRKDYDWAWQFAKEVRE